MDFNAKFNVTHECISTNLIGPCLDCLSVYQTLNNFYDGIRAIKGDKFCFDTRDKVKFAEINERVAWLTIASLPSCFRWIKHEFCGQINCIAVGIETRPSWHFMRWHRLLSPSWWYSTRPCSWLRNVSSVGSHSYQTIRSSNQQVRHQQPDKMTWTDHLRLTSPPNAVKLHIWNHPMIRTIATAVDEQTIKTKFKIDSYILSV